MMQAMSDDVIPISSAPVGGPSDDGRVGISSASSSGAAQATARDVADTPAQRRKAGLARKFRFMTHLMTNLDALVYAELCALYYMDCSFFRLLVRLVVQSFFLSPKSDEFVMLMPTHRPHVVAILIPNAVCMLLHLFSSLPQAGETTRGYLHGGVIIDFIGQKAPSSHLALLLLDFAVMALQCVMLAVHTERELLRKFVSPGSRVSASSASASASAPTATATPPTPPPPNVQDHDIEERGLAPRRARIAADATNDIELQPLQRAPSTGAGGDGAGDSTHGRRRPDLRDYMISGNASLGDFHVLRSITAAGDDYQSAAAQSLQTIGYAATLARLAAEPRSRIARLGTAQQRSPQQ